MPLTANALVHRVFMVLAGVIGFFLFVMASICFTNMSPQCTASKIYDSILTVMLLGLILITMSGSYMACTLNYACYFADISGTFAQTYSGFIFIILLGLVITLGIAGSDLPDHPDCTASFAGATTDDKNNARQLKTFIWSMFAISLMMLFGTIGVIWYVNNAQPHEVTPYTQDEIANMAKKSGVDMNVPLKPVATAPVVYPPKPQGYNLNINLPQQTGGVNQKDFTKAYLGRQQQLRPNYQ